MKHPFPWPQLVGMIFLCLVSCVIEPCDGHSCDQEVTIKE
jgi:hypothetical protein